MTPQQRPRLVLVGRRIHRDTCGAVRDRPVAAIAVFEGDGSRDVALAVVADDLQPCKVCKPIRSLAWWEHQQIKARVR